MMSGQADASAFEATHEEARLERQAAYSYLEEAFAEARVDGLDGDCLAHAALFAAFKELVETYGEEATATFAEGLADKVRKGAYTAGTRH
jgi:hypothetical protein